MDHRLAINTGFAVNRYCEPEDYIRIIGSELGIRYVQLTADMLNPDLPDQLLRSRIEKLRRACKEYDVTVCSTFTGAYTRVNHLAHPDPAVRRHWVEWFKRYVDITADLECNNMGSHFGILSHEDNIDPVKRRERVQQNIESWHEVAKYAAHRGLSYISWEPMSISREQGETIAKTRDLQKAVNRGTPLPFKICLDVDHGDVTSPNPDDTNCYKWLQNFAKESPLIHLKQSSENKSGHWPFTRQHNAVGQVTPKRVIDTLDQSGSEGAYLILELSFREREPIDSQVVEILKESTAYWRKDVVH